MKITHTIAHHLQRDAEHDAQLLLRENELSMTEQTESLLELLKRSFKSRLTREHGSFNPEKETSFLQSELSTFLNGEQSLLSLSSTFMKRIESEINNSGIEIDAHFIFFIEELKAQQIFYLLIASNNESLAIDDALDVTSHCYIDTGATLSGVKVDIGEWQKSRNYPYITFVPSKGNILLSDSMHMLTGFDNCVDKEEATGKFLQGVESFSKFVPEENVKEYREKIVEYCVEQEKNDEPINIPGLSKELNGIDCDKFVREMLSHNPKSEEDVIIDRNSLKKYIRFSGREKDLTISFSSFQLNQRVFYDEASDTLSINGLPKALRNQLLKHLSNL